jgi:hypothetical protein
MDLSGSGLSNIDETKAYQCNAEKKINGTAGTLVFAVTMKNFKLEAFHNTTSCNFENTCRCHF